MKTPSIENKNYDAIPENDIEQGNYQINSASIEDKMRAGFIKKVYGILFAQLFMTFIVVAMVLSSDGFAIWQNQNMWLMWLCIIITIIIVIAITCFPSNAKTVPLNYILLTTFTLCESYLISKACVDAHNIGTVMMAASMTCAMVLALTVYAWVTDTDFTTSGSILFCCGIALALFSLFALFTSNKIVHTILASLSVLLFSIYLIFDTQLIVGRHENKLDYDDYIIGALMLYLDVVIIFLNLLKLLGNR